MDISLGAFAKTRADQPPKVWVLGNISHVGFRCKQAGSNRVVNLGGGMNDLKADPACPGIVVPSLLRGQLGLRIRVAVGAIWDAVAGRRCIR